VSAKPYLRLLLIVMMLGIVALSCFRQRPERPSPTASPPSITKNDTPEMTPNDIEGKLKNICTQMASAAAGEHPALNEIDALSAEGIKAAGELAEYYRREFSAQPELNEWLANRPEFQMTTFDRARVVLCNGSTEAEILDCWRVQLRANAEALTGIVADDPGITKNWLYWGDISGKRRAGLPFFRAQQVRDCFKEIRKLAQLLTLPRDVVGVSKGDVLFKDEFNGDLAAWQSFGSGEFITIDGRLKVKGEGATIWCARDFEDAIISFDYCPATAAKNGAGALFAFPAATMPGNSYEISAGPMEYYNAGINTYHVSLYRGSSNTSNLRRTGLGLKMLSPLNHDPCSELGRAYHVEIVKSAETIQVYVDGRLCHAYVDAGCYGPRLNRGRFGIRHFSGGELEAYYSHFEVFKVRVGR